MINHRCDFTPADLSHSAWREMDRASKVALCRAIAAGTDKPEFKFSEITLQRFCDREEELALFVHKGETFVVDRRQLKLPTELPNL